MKVAQIAVPVLTVLLAATSVAQAQSVKPGLWDSTVLRLTVDGKDMLAQMNAAQEQMRKSLAQLPPDQRKRMEAMMSAQSGGGATSRICISPEMAAKDGSMFQRPANSECETPKFSKNGNRTNFEMSCKQGGTQTVAKGETLIAGDQMTTKVDAVVTEAGGVKRTSVTETQMKFVSSDCGSVKPVDQLMKDIRTQMDKGAGPAPAKK
ncbi:DUF3617 domain-containing protein [Ottowia thiooxydans]|uniref:DUF3617 domain-containing protein n=1 Tax=Ottowia thiooxydans TaxID=219182 RepID=A0ABV2Q500_9BURK